MARTSDSDVRLRVERTRPPRRWLLPCSEITLECGWQVCQEAVE